MRGLFYGKHQDHVTKVYDTGQVYMMMTLMLTGHEITLGRNKMFSQIDKYKSCNLFHSF